jgi:hypothetical protein
MLSNAAGVAKYSFLKIPKKCKILTDIPKNPKKTPNILKTSKISSKKKKNPKILKNPKNTQKYAKILKNPHYCYY